MSKLTGERSAFPAQLDIIEEKFNLSGSNVAKANEYKRLKSKANITAAETEILEQLSSELRSFIIDAHTWNYFGDVIVNMQDHYKNNTEGYIQNLQETGDVYLRTTRTHMDETVTSLDGYASRTTQHMDDLKDAADTHADLKREEFQTEIEQVTFKGEWEPHIQYYARNVVAFNGNGYMAEEDSKGQSPGETSSWSKITQKGDKGDPSLNINYKGMYNSGKVYNMGDAITYGGYWYYAKEDGIINVNPTDASKWELNSNQTVISDSQPFDIRMNLWIDTNSNLIKYYSAENEKYLALNAEMLVDSNGTNKTTPAELTIIKDVVSKIPANPKYTDTQYSHPSNHSAEMITETDTRKFVSPNEKLTWNGKIDKSGGSFTGPVYAKANPTPTKAQVRNIIFSTEDASASSMEEGEIWIKYK